MSAARKSLSQLARVRVFDAADDRMFKERLLAKCIPEPNSGCWLWMGASKAQGYGQMRFRGRFEVAHRVSFILFCRELSDGEVVCHSCDNPYCVNPAHLWAGTTKDNIRDCISKGRAKRGVLFGKDNPSTKLSAEDMAEIMNAPFYYGVNRDLAKKFNMHHGYICQLRANK